MEATDLLASCHCRAAGDDLHRYSLLPMSSPELLLEQEAVRHLLQPTCVLLRRRQYQYRN